MPNALLSLAAAALVMAMPAAAGAPSTSGRVTARVPHSDLDLASAAGQAALDRRLSVAAASLCGAANPIDPAGNARRRDCMAAARASAQPAVAAAVRARVERQEMALRR